jgi:mannose-6-phosphate isomerase-like protein (cupin superfamily)
MQRIGFPVSFLCCLLLISPVFSQTPPDYTQLDPRPYVPGKDPDPDMFMGHWKESSPRHTFGTLIERDLLTRLDGDSLHPRSRGAVLQFINRFTYGTLSEGYATVPSTLKGEQLVLFIDSGEGSITAGGKTARLVYGIGVLLPPNLEFTLKNTGVGALTLYIISEPVPPSFTPNKDMLLRNLNTMPGGVSGHWSHIPKAIFMKKDGLATMTGVAPVWFDGMTMGQPHSHCPGSEEIWFSVRGNPYILLGKKLRQFPPGTAYKIPSDNMTPHSTINPGKEPVLTFWFMVVPEKEPQAPSYSKLDDVVWNKDRRLDVGMFFRNWRASMPKNTHGSLVERDVLLKGDPMKPAGVGTVLKYVNRFTHASLYAHSRTVPTTLKGEQEIFYILSGKGIITAGKKTAELSRGITVLMPENLAFIMQNSGSEPLEMYLVSEPCPAGFRPNADMLVVDENTTPVSSTTSHWVGIVKPLLATADGLGTLESILTCEFSPMTFFQPHSHRESAEEVWVALDNDTFVMLGMQIWPQAPGTAYMIPPDMKTPHANFNVSDHPVKLFYFARLTNHEPRK